MPRWQFNRYEELKKLCAEHDSDACLIWPHSNYVVVPGHIHTTAKILAFELHHKHMPDGRVLADCKDSDCINWLHLRDSGETQYQYLLRMIPRIDTNDCVLWPFGTTNRGYGFLCLPSEPETRYFAHRVAYKIVHGEFPEPVGRHTCDNPPCFNPRHIICGTQTENMADKAGRGRQPRGEDLYNAILNASQVREIRAEYVHGKRGHGYDSLARKYGVKCGTIRNLINGRSWTHVR